MKSTDIIKSCIKSRGMTQAMLAEQMGFKHQSSIAEQLRRENIGIENFVKILNTMGYDIIVKDRNGANNENCWKVEVGCEVEGK